MTKTFWKLECRGTNARRATEAEAVRDLKALRQMKELCVLGNTENPGKA